MINKASHTTKAASAGQASPEFLGALRAAVGAAGVVTDPAVVAPHLTNNRDLWQGQTPAVVWPASTEEVSKVLRICRYNGMPVVPQGGNTGLVGGGIPDGAVVLAMGRMNRIREVDPLNSTLVAEAGCILANVHSAAASADRLFPLSLASEGSCQIGGTLSTNAGGTNVLRYGTARQLVLGLEVVLPDGRILNGLSTLRKDNTGYDLKNLFIGAEGTLGIITAAALRLFPMPRTSVTAFVACPTARGALAIYDQLRAAAGDTLSMFEYMERFGLQMVLDHAEGAMDPFSDAHPCYVLVELSSPDTDANLRDLLENQLAEAVQRGTAIDAVVGRSGKQDAALRYLRESLSEAQKPEGASIKHDVSVPVSKVAEFIERASAACQKYFHNARLCPCGHFGDGNIHFNISQPVGMRAEDFLSHYAGFNRIVHDIVADMGGSVSAEHGIGQLRREELERYKDPVAMELMRQIKGMLDPDGIMNPGKVLALQ